MNSAQGPNRTWTGFTLIELLVVIAIIALLVSMLLPALARSKEKGRAIVCLNNEKQVALSMRMYIDDYRGRFPPRFPDPDSSTPPYPCKSCRTTNWTVYLTQPNYLSLSNRVFACPSDNGIPDAFPGDPFNTTTQMPRPKRLVDLQEWNSSFCFNAVLSRLGVEVAVPQPSNTGLIGEIFPWHAPKQLALYALSTGTNRAVSQAIALDGHSSRPTPADVTAACKLFEVPGIDGPIP